MSLYRAKQEATALNPDRRFLLRHICFDKTIVRAQGHYLYDEAGTAYFDALSQYGALPFGHNPPRIWARIDEVRVFRRLREDADFDFVAADFTSERAEIGKGGDDFDFRVAG